MAEHTHSDAHLEAHSIHIENHRDTYKGFIKGAVALTLIAFFVLVALVAIRFGQSLNVFTGFVGLGLGLIAVAIDWRMNSRWLLSLGVLVLFGLLTAIKVS